MWVLKFSWQELNAQTKKNAKLKTFLFLYNPLYCPLSPHAQSSRETQGTGGYLGFTATYKETVASP